MNASELQSLARRQLSDYDSHSPGTMFADEGFSLTVEDAYRLQIETARLREMRGEAIAGYKIGCVSKTVQQQLGISHAIFGHVFEHEIRAEGAVLPSNEFDRLAIEGELALTLAEDVGDLRELGVAPWLCIAEVFPVVELHNYVLRGPKRNSAAELIANNAIHAGAVIPRAKALAEGLGAVEISVSINGDQRGMAEVDPFATLYELATLLRGRGISLRRGDIVLTGSPLPLYAVGAADRIKVSCPAIADVAATVT